jgi:hypothetical protein
MLLCLSVLCIAFCDINAVLHGSTVTHERIRIIFGLYADCSCSLHNPGRNKYQCLGSRTRSFVILSKCLSFLCGDKKVYA